MENRSRGISVLLALGLLGLLIAASLLTTPPVAKRSYSQFIAEVHAGNVKQVKITGRLLVAEPVAGAEYQVQLPQAATVVQREMVQQGVDVVYSSTGAYSLWTVILSMIVPIALVGGFIWLVGRAGSGGSGQVLQFGESKARLYTPGEKRVTMNDVAGMAEVKEELWEIVDFLRSPERYLELGARIPKGVLLAGPPGTGKTLLARAIAGEAGVPFYAISGSDFVEMFAGVGASRVRDLFARAKTHAPCIIFVDEIDAVARGRGLSVGSGNEEREQTLNQLLVEMDGFSVNEGIIVVAATNRADVLDAAILRPGRFDRQITVDLPDRQGRREILDVHTVGKPMAPSVNLDRVAAITSGFTGADLANLVNEAALLTARQRESVIPMESFRQAFERVITGGPAQRRQMAADERHRVAVHEAGHAVVALKLPNGNRVEKVTITPRGRALGYVMYTSEDDKHLHSRTEIRDRLVVMLGGRAAEEVVLGEVTTGASDDLERATSLARRMVTELGMDESIGPVAVQTEFRHSSGPGAGRTAERTALAVDVAVQRLVVEAYARAKEHVVTQREALDRVTLALLEQESLDGTQLDDLVGAMV